MSTNTTHNRCLVFIFRLRIESNLLYTNCLQNADCGLLVGLNRYRNETNLTDTDNVLFNNSNSRKFTLVALAKSRTFPEGLITQ